MPEDNVRTHNLVQALAPLVLNPELDQPERWENQLSAALRQVFQIPATQYRAGFDALAQAVGANRLQLEIMLSQAGAGPDPMAPGTWPQTLERVWTNLANLRQLPSTRELQQQNLDLFQARLPNIDLSDSRLPGADLREADLSGAKLHRTDLQQSNGKEANLSWAKGNEVILRFASLRRANLFQAELPEADLRDSDLAEANLKEASLANTKLQRANLSSANLSSANLTQANLQQANLEQANLEKANLEKARLGTHGDQKKQTINSGIPTNLTRCVLR